MVLRVLCPCSRELRLDESLAGKRILCPTCNRCLQISELVPRNEKPFASAEPASETCDNDAPVPDKPKAKKQTKPRERRESSGRSTRKPRQTESPVHDYDHHDPYQQDAQLPPIASKHRARSKKSEPVFIKRIVATILIVAALSLSGVAIHAFLPKLLSKLSPGDNQVADRDRNDAPRSSAMPFKGGFTPRLSGEPPVQYERTDVVWGIAPTADMSKHAFGLLECYLPSDFVEDVQKRKSSAVVRKFHRAPATISSYWLSIHDKKNNMTWTEYDFADLLQAASDELSGHPVGYSLGTFSGNACIYGKWTAKAKTGTTYHSSYIIPLGEKMVFLMAWAESSSELTEMENALQMTQFVATTP